MNSNKDFVVGRINFSNNPDKETSMADISMCQDKKCPSRTLCYRFIAKPSKWQLYTNFKRKKEQLKCLAFWDNEKEPT